MVVLSLIEGEYELHDNIGEETILKEYKEFYLTDSIHLNDINDLKQGILSTKIQELIYKSMIDYTNKYFDRYLLSLTNISKIHLPKLLNQTHSKICFGVSDKGDITGIPLLSYQIEELKTNLVNKVIKHYSNVIGLHNKKGDFEIKINNEIYYDFSKLVEILKKHTRINIHKIKNNNNFNIKCEELLENIKQIKFEEQEYLKKWREYRRLMNIKVEYNNKYSVPFNKLIRAEEIMKEFREFTSLSNEQLDELLEILKEKIINRGDVEDYLCCGEYIQGSLFPDDECMDQFYGELVKIYLEEYKYFKTIQLRKNITLEKFILKNPIKRLNPILNNVSVFDEYLKMDYYMIEIEVPFIKDINAYIVSKKNKKILERGYTNKTPCTI
jgi:hemoglobin-like flavoprotein